MESPKAFGTLRPVTPSTGSRIPGRTVDTGCTVFVMLRFAQRGLVHLPWRDRAWLNLYHQGSVIAKPVTRRQHRVCRVRSAARPCRWMWRSSDVKPKIGDGFHANCARASGIDWERSRVALQQVASALLAPQRRTSASPNSDYAEDDPFFDEVQMQATSPPVSLPWGSRQYGPSFSPLMY